MVGKAAQGVAEPQPSRGMVSVAGTGVVVDHSRPRRGWGRHGHGGKNRTREDAGEGTTYQRWRRIPGDSGFSRVTGARVAELSVGEP